jgi:HlyD family secretion protein
MKTRTKVIWLAIAALAGAALVWALRPSPVAVEIAAITRGPFDKTVDEQAKTRVRNHYVISTPLTGTVERITLIEGDSVKPGETIAVLHPTEPSLLDARTRSELVGRLAAAQAAKEHAEVGVAAAQAELAQARIDLDRTTKLAAQNLVAKAKVETDTLTVALKTQELEAARASVHVAQHDIDVARAALSRASGGASDGSAWLIRSPVQGRLVRVMQVSEATLGIGAPLVEIADAADLEVVVEVLTADAAQVKPGARVELSNWGGSGTLEGRVRRIEPLAFTKISALGVEEQRVNVIVDILTPPSERPSLGEGYRVDARISTYHNDNVLRVPTGALFRSGDRWSVYAVTPNGRARLTPVEIGQRNAADAELLKGLAAGDRVVVYPSDAVKDGTRIASSTT